MSSEPEPSRKRYDLTTAAHDYPVWEGPPRETLLICAHPRSGSTLLGEALYFAGGFGCPLEYFHSGFRPDLAARWGTTNVTEHAGALHRLRTDPGGVMSIKIFWRDVVDIIIELDPENFGPEVERARPEDLTPADYRRIAEVLEPLFPNARHVHLWRRDRIRLAVSSLKAVQTGEWRAIPETGTQTPRGTLEFDFDRIDALIAYADFCHAHWRNYFAAIGVTPYELTYEDLAADYENAVRGLLDHLGSDAAVPAVRMQRQAGASNEAFVLRYLREHRERVAGA